MVTEIWAVCTGALIKPSTFSRILCLPTKYVQSKDLMHYSQGATGVLCNAFRCIVMSRT